jgi:hypothetical protein
MVVKEPEPEPERCSSRGFFHGTTTGRRAGAAAALSSQAAARPPCSALHCRPAPAAPICMHACNKDRSRSTDDDARARACTPTIIFSKYLVARQAGSTASNGRLFFYY